MKDERDQIIKQNNPNPYRDKVEERMNLEAGWYCNKEDESPIEHTTRMRQCEHHSPILEKFVEDGREHEAEQIKENIQRMMKRGMLSEEDEKALKEKFMSHKKEYDAPKCEVMEPDKAEWNGYVPDGDLGVTDRSVPGDVSLSLRKHGWFVCHKDETAALWESRYDEVKRKEDVSFGDKVKDYLNFNTNTVGYVSTGNDEPMIFAEQVKENSFTDIIWKLNALHNRKNHDYGNAAHESYKEFGLISYVIRLNDKMNRLKSLTKPGAEQQVADEKIEDTLMDLAAYAIMAIESLHSDD